ncbi:MAG: helix-turn-helix domain-containing protein [Burkholderiaceae bacterium]
MAPLNAGAIEDTLIPAWEAFHALSDVGAIRNAAHHKRMLGLLDLLMQASEGKPRHPAVPLIGIVARLIEDWESDRLPLAPQRGRDALRYLMNAHRLKQSDLPEVASQGVISEVLSGKRQLNVRQIRALSERFGVSPETFLS